MAASRPRPEGPPSLECLDDNELEAVLHAAKQHARDVAPLASTCSRFNKLARKRIPIKLRLPTYIARQLVRSRSPPFSACRALECEISTPTDLNLATAVLVRYSSSWQQLQEVRVDVTPARGEHGVSDDAVRPLREDTAATGLLGCLQGLQGLAKLSLYCPAVGSSSMYALGRLTGLRSLWLSCDSYQGGSVDWEALRALQHLTDLGVSAASMYVEAGPPPMAAGGTPILPPSLQVLYVSSGVLPTTWWEQLAACPDLQELRVSCRENLQFAACHPRQIAAAAAQHCKQLTHLEVGGPPDMFWEDGEGGLLIDPWHPCEGLAGLSNLRYIACAGGCQLVLGSADDWRVLGTLQQLTALYGWRATAPPPAGLRLPAVVNLWGTCEDAEGQVLRGLLMACPQLQTIDITVVLSPQEPAAQQQVQGQELQQQGQQQQQQQQVPGQAQPQGQGQLLPGQQQGPQAAQQQQQQQQEAQPPGEAQPPPANAAAPAGQVQGAAGASSTVSVAIVRYQLEAGMPATSLPLHFAAVAPALAGLRELTLAWPTHRGHLLVVPDLSPLTRLETLNLHGEFVWDEGVFEEPDGVYDPHQQVVTMLLPVRATLQDLELAHVREVTPRVALLLQDSFPRLRSIHLAAERPDDPLTIQEMEEWKEVKAALRPDLRLFAWLTPYLENPLNNVFASHEGSWLRL